MKKQQNNSTKAWALQVALSVALLSISAVLLAASFNSTTGQANKAPTDEANHHDCDHHGNDCNTATPIKHVIVLIGENWTFDSIFATYQPRHGQSVGNLLSRGYVTASGAPGPDFADSQQFQINQPYPATYFIDAMSTAGKTAYSRPPARRASRRQTRPTSPQLRAASTRAKALSIQRTSRTFCARSSRRSRGMI